MSYLIWKTEVLSGKPRLCIPILYSTPEIAGADAALLNSRQYRHERGVQFVVKQAHEDQREAVLVWAATPSHAK